MPDQYGRVTGQDWLGLTGAISNIDSMRRGREYLGMQRAKEGRSVTLFDQSQEDRAIKLRVQQDVANEYTQGGIVDPHGQITEEGYKAFANPHARDKGTAVKGLEGKGKDAFAYLKASTEYTGQLLLNATNQKSLQMLAFDKANQNYEKISGLLKAAQVEEGRGQSGEAAQYIASAIEGGMMRRHAKVVGDKIEIWEVVGGVKQPSEILTVQEALMEAQNYTRENYTTQAATHIIAGHEQNKEPKVFEFRTPEGKGARAVQIFKSGEVDYIFFNPDGTVLKDAPENIEQAYSQGWMKEEDVLERERGIAKEKREVMESTVDVALKEAKIKKVRAETGQIGKAKPTKPEKPESAIDALTESEKLWRIIDDPENKTVDGKINSGSLRNFNDLQRQRNLPLVSEQKNAEGTYEQVPDVGIYVNKGDKLEKTKTGSGIEYIKGLPVQTQELVMQVVAERQAGKASKLRGKRKGKQEKANVQRETMRVRQGTEAAASKRNILYRQVDEAIRR